MLCLTLLAPVAAQSQPPEHQSLGFTIAPEYASLLGELEQDEGVALAAYAEIPPLPQQGSPVHAGPEFCTAADGGVVPCHCQQCVRRCRENRWFAGVELTSLQPSYSNSEFGINDDEGALGPRLYLGWESSEGGGIRSRFWGIGIDSEINADTPIPRTMMEIDAFRIDVDFYRRYRLRKGDVTLGASVTAAGLQFDFDDVVFEARSSGGGVGFFAEGRHAFWSSNISQWAMLAKGRWAFLVGEWVDENRPGRTRADANLDLTEAFLGLEYTRHLARIDWVFQYGIEAQSWEATYLGDVSFLGSTTRIGVLW